jgi:hypothetical protein
VKIVSLGRRSTTVDPPVFERLPSGSQKKGDEWVPVVKTLTRKTVGERIQSLGAEVLAPEKGVNAGVKFPNSNGLKFPSSFSCFLLQPT